MFADTLVEDEDAYRLNEDIARITGKELNWLKDGRTIWEFFIDDKKVGNSLNANCSATLKTAQVKAWIEANCGPDSILVLGMDYGELDRIERAQEKWKPRQVVSLLNQYKVYRPAYDEWLSCYGIKKPRLYEMGFPHNNCGGFCVRAGQKQFATLLLKFPERYKWHEEEELHAHYMIGKDAKRSSKWYPFIKIIKNGKTRYVTMRQFRKLIASGEHEVDLYDWGACGCFID